MKPKVIEWDGSHLPKELRELPPGRYAIEPMEPPETLSEDEEQGVLAGLQGLDAGRGIPLVDVICEIRTCSSEN